LEETIKVPFYQRIWFVMLFLVFIPPIGILFLWLNKRFNLAVKIILTIVFGYWIVILFGYMTDSKTTTQLAATAAKQAVTEQQPEIVVPDNTPQITLAEFDTIKKSMTYDEIVAIVGSPGTLSYGYEEDMGNETRYIQAYTFEGSGDNGANVILSFQNGVLSMKTQSGLK